MPIGLVPVEGATTYALITILLDAYTLIRESSRSDLDGVPSLDGLTCQLCIGSDRLAVNSEAPVISCCSPFEILPPSK